MMQLHATAVAFDQKAVVITGPSGAGKSSLALQMMAFGADLVADDQVILTSNQHRLCLPWIWAKPKQSACPCTVM